MSEPYPFHDYMTLKERVYLYLQSQIISGNLKPGERIKEKGICYKLNISRTPLREALMKLEAEKFIQIIPHRGFLVKVLTLEEIEEIYTVISNLEGLAAGIAISKMDAQHFEMLNQTMEKMRSALEKNDLEEYNIYNVKFHEVYIKASGNELIVEIIALLKKRFYEHTAKMRMLPEWEKKTMKEHEQMLDLIHKRDAKGLERFIQEVHWNFEENLPYIKKAFLFNSSS